ALALGAHRARRQRRVRLPALRDRRARRSASRGTRLGRADRSRAPSPAHGGQGRHVPRARGRRRSAGARDRDPRPMSDRIGPLERIDDFRWRLPATFRPGMRVPGIVYADASMARRIVDDRSLEQVANVATLPGIVRASLAMPDIHWGYGFPIGGVAAFDEEEGVVAAGGVGYDINCGTRIVRTDLTAADVRPVIDRLADALYGDVPAGLGSRGTRETDAALERAFRDGARWAVELGRGWDEDLTLTEEGGAMPGADPAAVSRPAKDRGRTQIGSLGSGNHFLEVETVGEILDAAAARVMGIDAIDQVVVFFHCGSRGLGHQV